MAATAPAPAIAQVANVAEWERLHNKQRTLAEVEALARGGRVSAEQAIDEVLGRIRAALPDPGEAVAQPAAPEPTAPPPEPAPTSRKITPAGRPATCSVCRRDFRYLKPGPIPKEPTCGRRTCRPVDASHRGPARD